jgi:translocation and assembly module TamB
MAEDPELSEESKAETPRRSGIGCRIAKWMAILLGAILLLLAAGYAFLNTDAGRRFVANQIEGLQFKNGMKIGIGELHGNLFGSLTVDRLTILDPQGEFLAIPEAKLDWRPLKYIVGHVDIHSLAAPTVTVERLPHFKQTQQQGPLLPNLDIDIGRLQVDRLVVEPVVTGTRRVLSVAGKAHISNGRAITDLDVQTIGIEGQTQGGDRLALSLDAVPEQNRLGIDLSLNAPAGGVIAAIAGLGKPLAATLKGKGDWAHWDGRLNATLGGTQLAGLDIAARDGRFHLQGDTRVAQLFQGGVANLLGPVTSVDLTADLRQRRAGLDGTISSDTLNLVTKGTVDLGQNRFDKLHISLALSKTAEIAKDLTGAGLRANLTFDGPFKAPKVDYDIAAARVGINDIALERLRAKGTVSMSDQGYLTPLHASVARITGLDTVAGGTLENVQLDGHLAAKGTRILSDDLHLYSRRLDAKVTMVADVSKGFYAGSINGRIDDYKIASVGIFNIQSKFDLKSGARGGFAIEGQIHARSTRITNGSVASFLGGQTVAAANVRYGTDGIVRASDIQLESPLVHIGGGSGTYEPGGRIAIDLNARTQRYGPVTLAVDGTLNNPHATLMAERPGLGIGLAGLSAEVTGSGSTYTLKAKGSTDYGPLTADVTLDLANAAAIKVNSANLGGIDFTGSLNQTAQGPFTGELQAHGKGLGGVVRLAAAGKYQQADFNLRANDTRLNGPKGLYLGSAIIDGRAVLYDRLQIQFDAQLADFTYDQYRLTAARAQVDYRGGRGAAKFVAEGTQAYPFRLAGNVEFEPDLWSATLKGRIRGVNIATKGPARIALRDGGYELLPTTLTIGDGTARLAGKYADGLRIQSRVEDIDLGLVNAFIPALGVGGRASGSFDFAQASTDAFPRADARIMIDNFTRTTAASVSEPVDIHFAGKLLADGGTGSAVFRAGNTVIGRMQASLRPLGHKAGSWVERLMAAPLSGGLRYNGPAGTLFSLAGMPDQRLSGPIGVAADFSGHVRAPQLNGVIKGNKLTYENLTYGTTFTDLAVDGSFTGDQIDIANLAAKAGDGTVKAQGYVSLAAARGFPMDVTIMLDNARLARSDNLSSTATGTLRLTKTAGKSTLLSGEIHLPQTRYRFVRNGSAEIPQLTGVHFAPPKGRAQITGNEQVQRAPNPFSGVRLDIKVTAPDRFYVSGMGLESEWRADLAVSGTSAKPRLTGTLSVVRGTLGFAGHSFDIKDGQVVFMDEPQINPRIAFTAQEEINGVTVQLNVSGRAEDPQIAFTSTPGLPQDEIVSRILFGDSVANLSSIQALQLAASLNSLRGTGGGFNPLGKLRSATGLDRLRVLGADAATGRGTAIAAGKYITNNIYVEVITDARGFTATQLEINLTPALSILSQAGGSGATNFSIRYEKNY